MYDVSIPAIEGAIDTVRKTLGDALLSVDVWDQTMGMPIASHNSNPVAAALFNEMTKDVNSVLSDSEMPRLGNQYTMNLGDDRIAVVLLFSERLAGAMLLQRSKCNIGVVSAIAVPRLLADIRAAEHGASQNTTENR